MLAIQDRPRRRSLAVLLVLALGLAPLAACTSDDGSDGSASTSTTASGGGEGGGTVVGSGDTYEATIRRTTDGVPHITAKTVAAASFGQGYASGQDRSCDLADQVVKIKGQRARWFGAGEDDANIQSDVKWLGIGIYERALKDWGTVPDEAKRLFDAYVAGWNAHLEEVGVDGLAGWCKGEGWVQELDPEDVYAYARSIALNASGSPIGAYIPTASPPATSTTTSLSTGPANLRAPVRRTAQRPAARPVDDGPQGLDALRSLSEDPVGSNGWAIGKNRSADGSGLLLANPHFPWEGELRFWEVHLTVPGKVDIYGAQLSGVPGIGIGFTKDFAWTHTVSAGSRFTAYSLDLVPGDPLTYRYGDETRPITPTEHRIEVLGDDGTLSDVTRTTYATAYGPVIDFPGYGWTTEHTISYRDANIDDDEFVEQYFGMFQAKTFDEFKAVHEKVNGIPLFNTIATSADGRAWYADTSATPDLSPEALAAYESSLASDPIVKIAADNRAVLLDGSDPIFEWVNEPGARDPGLVPPSKQPQVEREDYVFNANDSFWVPNATHLLTGDYSPLHGRQGTVRSPRTRENAVMLDDTTAKGASGTDGFTLDEVADAALHNEAFTARSLRELVVERCQAAAPVTVPALPDDEGVPGLPAATVDVAAACKVLDGWDGIYDLDRAGPLVWRELLAHVDDTSALWATPFDPADPIGTPSGLAPAPAGGPDPVLLALARAVQVIDVAGLDPDATLGTVQFAIRDGKTIPIHGGLDSEGTTNVVGKGSGYSILDPALDQDLEPVAVGSRLRKVDGKVGYVVDNGTSFLMAVAFGKGGPKAKAFLTYSDTEDRKDPNYTAATQRFSDKDWRDVAFTEDAVAADTKSTITVKG
ncbi:N-acyl homoserine lactone acylase QqaR [soil metagenome]